MAETIDAGTRVKVLWQSRYKVLKLVGRYGTVKSTWYTSGSIAVKLDGLDNPSSEYGYFYFSRRELEIVKEENSMEETTMNNITNYLNIAKVRYINESTDSTNVYDCANFDAGLYVDDTVVVKSAHHGFGVAKVVEIVYQNDIETAREIVAKVDMYPYEERVAARAKAAELKTKMQERAKKLQDIALYQMLAEKDSEMAELLRDYQAIGL